jgi:hypothetical protein
VVSRHDSNLVEHMLKDWLGVWLNMMISMVWKAIVRVDIAKK